MAADSNRERHIMSQICERRRVPTRCAGSTLATISLNPIHGNQCAQRLLIPVKNPARDASPTLSPTTACSHPGRAAPVSRIHQGAANLKSP